MTTGSTGTKRRTFFQRGLALLAGGAALGGGARWADAASPPPPAPATITLYARQRPIAGAPDGRLVSAGDLLDGPDGTRIGGFFTNSFCMQSPFGGPAPAASSLEFQVLQLTEGTLFTIASGSDDAAAGRPLAIVGGTGRYAGRSGSCVERGVAGAHAGDDVRELLVTFAG
jgi:hypothetical protein